MKRNCDLFKKGIRDFIFLKDNKIVICLLSEMSIANRTEKYINNFADKLINS